MSVEVLRGREVPLGGPRALMVRRTLPHRDRNFIGAWCFVDHYGPTPVSAETGMDLPPHPHTNLQTVSWLFEGRLEHRDSGGHHAFILPGEVNLMTAGRGIAHSEVSTPDTTVLHGVQLWLALPRSAADVARAFEPYAPHPSDLAVEHGRAEILVFLGAVAGIVSPVATYTPLLGAQITLEPVTSLVLPLDTDHEHAVLLDTGSVCVDDAELMPGDLGCVDAGALQLRLTSGPDGARVLLLGGEPFEEEIVMWWNFVGRDHDEVAQARQDWQDQGTRFGHVEGYEGRLPWLPAPEMPHGRLQPRGRRPAHAAARRAEALA
jgi:redox-sensitive bicupin YhaK (pirin superfamily)